MAKRSGRGSATVSYGPPVRFPSYDALHLLLGYDTYLIYIVELR